MIKQEEEEEGEEKTYRKEGRDSELDDPGSVDGLRGVLERELEEDLWSDGEFDTTEAKAGELQDDDGGSTEVKELVLNVSVDDEGEESRTPLDVNVKPNAEHDGVVHQIHTEDSK